MEFASQTLKFNGITYRLNGLYIKKASAIAWAKRCRYSTDKFTSRARIVKIPTGQYAVYTVRVKK